MKTCFVASSSEVGKITFAIDIKSFPDLAKSFIVGFGIPIAISNCGIRLI